MRGQVVFIMGMLAGGCSSPSGVGLGAEGESGGRPEVASTTGVGNESATSTVGGPSTGADPQVRFDVGDDVVATESDTSTGPGEPICTPQDDMTRVRECDIRATPNNFDSVVQWSWPPEGGGRVVVTPLVANLTDDDGNGQIDLCDTPDVVVVAAMTVSLGPARLVVLDGATGEEHFRIGREVGARITPALGDIDGDGLVEIVTATNGGATTRMPSYLIAFEHDGTFKWQSDVPIVHGQGFAVALADIDHDGDVEIIADDTVVDETGALVWEGYPQAGWSPYFSGHYTATAVADLDGDGDMEIILGQSAYRVDGSVYWRHTDVEPGFPQVFDMDGDLLPEVVVTNRAGITVIQHDGTVTTRNATPTGAPYGSWFRPGAAHDFDGDQVPEFAMSSADQYSLFRPDFSSLWDAPVDDMSGAASGTAFDFLGDGRAEAIYADEEALFVFDRGGDPLLTVPRRSPTLIEYPVVVDVDNDGASEILVVSSDTTVPALQVIRDRDDQWVQSRRIWNQHTYHVTNVREDGSIPQFEPPSWADLNTYRTNAQIEGGSLCKPPPPPPE